MMHELKCDQRHFAEVKNGRKTFELRFNDRGFAVGHVIRLMEYETRFPREFPSAYTGAMCYRVVTHILTHEDFPQAISPGWVIMSLKPWLAGSFDAVPDFDLRPAPLTGRAVK